MNDSFQALEFHPEQGNLCLRRREPLECGPHDCLISIKYAGVCGTDIQIMMGKFPCAQPYIVLGHEISGFVVRVGSRVESIHLGDRVAVNASRPCMRCDECKNDKPKNCTRGGIRHPIGIFRDGGWAEYCIVHEQQVFELPEKVSLEMGVLASPMACVSSAMKCLGNPPPTARVLIIGAGVMAHLLVATIIFSGVSNLFCIEERIIQKEFFKKAYPHIMVGSLNEMKTRRRRQGQWLLHAIIDCEGRSDIIMEIFDWLDQKGKLLLFGMNYKSESLELNPFEIAQKELKVLGSSFSDPKEFLAGIKWLELLGPEILNYQRMGIHTFILKYFREALERYILEEINKAIFHIPHKKCCYSYPCNPPCQ